MSVPYHQTLNGRSANAGIGLSKESKLQKYSVLLTIS